MGKVRFSILEKPPDRILREDMKFKGMHRCALRFALSAARSAAQVAADGQMYPDLRRS